MKFSKVLVLLLFVAGSFGLTQAQVSENNKRAAEFLQQEEYSKALPIFQQLVKDEGPRLDLLLGLSESLAGTDKLEEALQLAEKLVTLYPGNGE